MPLNTTHANFIRLLWFFLPPSRWMRSSLPLEESAKLDACTISRRKCPSASCWNQKLSPKRLLSLALQGFPMSCRFPLAHGAESTHIIIIEIRKALSSSRGCMTTRNPLREVCSIGPKLQVLVTTVASKRCHSGVWLCAGALLEVRPRLFGSVFVQGTRGVPGPQHTVHGGDGGAHGGTRISSSGSAAVGGDICEEPALLFGPCRRLLEAGGGDREERSAARDSGSEHKHGGGRPQRRGCCLCTASARR